jgi:SPP1 gp7 family putative phage head morphogenesis protein
MASKYDSRRIWMNTGASAKLKNLALEEKTVRRTQRIYREAQKDIEAQVAQIYSQIGTLSKANRWEFQGAKTPAKRKDISSLIEAIDKAGLTDYVPEKLSKRMSVLQVKEMNIWLRIHEAGQESHAATKEAILKTMQNSGKAWASALVAGADSFVGFDRNICGYMMGANWAGGNFSSRLWNASEETWEKVRDELTRALANGQQPETTKAHIKNLLTQAHNPDAKGSGGIAYDVERIIRTENAKASTDADMARWKDAGVTKIQWNAVLEKNTCPHCADRDGRVYLLKDIYKLDTVPLHPNCRCFFTAYDETAAKYPDTTYYKNNDGEYQEVQWAPYRALIGKDGKLRASPLQVADYFWNASPWMSYKAPTTGVAYQGEIDPQILDVTERAVQTVGDIFPEIRERLDISFNGEIYMHRGLSTVIGNRIESIGGLTDAENRQLTISYPSRAGGKNHLHELAQSMAENFLKGNISSPDVNHAIVHELGHVLEYDLKLKGRANAEQIVLKATRARTWERAKTVIGAKISTYGATDPSEAFAEIFAKMMTQRPDLQDDITARFVTELQKARSKPATKRRIGIK